jgi:hypothetical protein
MESENFAFFENEYQKCQILTFCEVSLAQVCSAWYVYHATVRFLGRRTDPDLEKVSDPNSQLSLDGRKYQSIGIIIPIILPFLHYC